jgi:predicted PurR-regulated permease PerM
VNDSGWQIFGKTIIVLATLLAALALYYAAEVVIILFIAIVFASAIRPVVDSLVRVVHFRSLAVLLIYLILLSTIGGLMIISIPPLVGLTVEFVTDGKLTQQVQSFADRLSAFGWERFRLIIPSVTLPEQLQTWLGQRAGDVAQRIALPIALSTVLGVTEFVLALLMTYYWLTARQQMLDLILAVSPPRHRTRLETIWTDVEETLGSFLRAEVILMSAIGILSFVGLVVLGVPYAPALAVVAALAEGIPLLGPVIGAIPALIVGFSLSAETGLLTLAWYLIIQEVEANVLFPRVMGRTVGMHPLLVIVALFVGAALHGVIGALIAVPIAGALQVAARHLLINPAIESHAPKTERGLVIFEKESEESDAARKDISLP